MRRQVLFYCHFPDMLLATRTSRLKAAYRAPLDALEQSTTGMARTLAHAYHLHLRAGADRRPPCHRRTPWL
jgi:hypothetical protein